MKYKYGCKEEVPRSSKSNDASWCNVLGKAAVELRKIAIIETDQVGKSIMRNSLGFYSVATRGLEDLMVSENFQTVKIG